VPPRRPDPHDPVWLIVWADASDAFPRWGRPEFARRDVEQLVQSIGFLVEVDPDYVTLATSVVLTDDGPEYGGGIHIPVPMVRRRARLA